MSELQLRDRYRDYRRLMQVRAAEPAEGSDDLIIEGEPVIFDRPYWLFRYGDRDVYEVIRSGAFDGADYRDVPLKYNHGDSHGTPARTTSKTERGKLSVTVDKEKITMRANLLHTSGGKDLYEEVRAGTVPQMSWAFTEKEGTTEVREEKEKITFVVKAVERVFDFAAVDFGANPETSIYARRRGDLDERTAKTDDLKRRALINKIIIKTKI